MHKRYIVIVLVILLVIMITGCATNGPAGAAPTTIVIEPTPQPTLESIAVPSGYILGENYFPSLAPPSMITEADFTAFGSETSFVFTGNISMTLPKEGKYFLSKGDNSLLINYGGISLAIKQSNSGPEDLESFYDYVKTQEHECSMGSETYNGHQFSYLSYSRGKELKFLHYEYYLTANTDYFCISIDTRKGTDTGDKIREILNSIKILDPLPGATIENYVLGFGDDGMYITPLPPGESLYNYTVPVVTDRFAD